MFRLGMVEEAYTGWDLASLRRTPEKKVKPIEGFCPRQS